MKIPIPDTLKSQLWLPDVENSFTEAMSFASVFAMVFRMGGRKVMVVR